MQMACFLACRLHGSSLVLAGLVWCLADAGYLGCVPVGRAEVWAPEPLIAIRTIAAMAADHVGDGLWGGQRLGPIWKRESALIMGKPTTLVVAERHVRRDWEPVAADPAR